jgi:hypothetical protein
MNVDAGIGKRVLWELEKASNLRIVSMGEGDGEE